MQNNKTYLLLRTMLLSTSNRNLLKHCTDKKRKSQTIGGMVGFGLVYFLIIVIGAFQAGMMGVIGMGDEVPALCAMAVSAIAFIFTLMKSNGYLFAFKEYDMLMSMPFEVKTVVSCKFMYMFIKSIGMPGSLVVSMLIGYGIAVHPPVYVYPLWLIMSVPVLLIPTILAAAIDALITSIGSGARIRKALQAIFLMAFCIACFFSRFLIEAIVRNTMEDSEYSMVSQISSASNGAGKYYLPISWFKEAVIDHRVSSMMLLVAVAILLFVGFYTFVAQKYREINTRLASHEVRRTRGEVSFKRKSISMSIAYKELRRFFGSVPYLVNVGMGHVLTLIVGLAFVVIGGDKIVAVMTNNAPFDPNVVVPALPFLVYFFLGMLATTCVTPSLEGKNAWIMQTMPIEKMTIYKGKMLFNILLGMPFALAGTILMMASFKSNAADWITSLVLITVQMLFSTTFGMVCGLKYVKLEWENEVEVVKQGANVAVYLLVNMVVSLIGMVGAVALGLIMPVWQVQLIFIALYGLLAFLFYLKVRKM